MLQHVGADHRVERSVPEWQSPGFLQVRPDIGRAGHVNAGVFDVGQQDLQVSFPAANVQ
jgi:hypothetical protein